MKETSTEKSLVLATVPGSLDRNPAAVYLASKPSVAGRRGLKRSLERAAEILTGGLATDALSVAWDGIQYQHVAALKSVLIDQGAKPATTNHVLSAVRGVVKEAFLLGLINAEIKERVFSVKGVPASALPAGRHVDQAEIRRLFAACSDTFAGRRDAAMLTLLYGCGVRRSEAAAITADNYRDGEIIVRSGKGRKERIVYAPAGGRAAIEAWLKMRGSWSGALLCPVSKGGKVQKRHMTAQAIMLRLWWIADKIGVQRFSPHDLRRSFVGELLDAGADISSVQKIAGHANVATTQRYDRRPEAAKRKAAELLHVPFTG